MIGLKSVNNNYFLMYLLSIATTPYVKTSTTKIATPIIAMNEYITDINKSISLSPDGQNGFSTNGNI